MKMLLITDVPPTSNYTAGIVLKDLCSFMQPEDLALYVVHHPHVSPNVDEDLIGIEQECTIKPDQQPFLSGSGIFKNIVNHLVEIYRSKVTTKRIARKIVAFAQQKKVDRIWCVLQGQTMFQLANDVSNSLKLPLHTTIWDPPGWWLRDNKVDPYSAKMYQNYFDKAVRNSASVMTASWAMSRTYADRYSTKCVHVIASLSEHLIATPKLSINRPDQVVIVLAGQLYAQHEINSLIQVFNKLNWTINGRDIVFRVIGNVVNFHTTQRCNIEFKGWHSQDELVQELEKADVLYCPYWFSDIFSEEANLSFPSKVTRYLAAGRPILFHGPEDASPAIFINQHKAGVVCSSSHEDDILKSLKFIVSDQNYSKLCENHRQLALDYFSHSSMKKQFLEFIGTDDLKLR